MLPGAVVIRQTTNFVEIENPGGFPEGITPDTAIRHAPVHRNRALCDLLDRVRLMERAGLGVDRIFEDQLRFGKLPPAYEGDYVALRLRIDSSTFDEPFARLIIDQERSGKSWTVEELLMLSYVRRTGAADRATLARVGQLSEPESQEVISSLTSADLLDRFGSGLATRYGLSAAIQERLGSAGKYTHERGLALEYQRSIILQHAAKFRRVDNRTVRDLLGISVGQAAKVLQGLESRGDLVQIGSKRWAFYELHEPSLPLT
jgi:ATP-dependent DNA helicase RecG